MEVSQKCLWTLLLQNFEHILNDIEYFAKLLKFLQISESNFLIYGSNGFPHDLILNEILKKKFKINELKKSENLWNKEILYFQNQYFIEIDMMHPTNIKNSSCIPQFIEEIIQNKHVNNSKHFFVIKNIDFILVDDFNKFRIIFERFAKNVVFICSTTKINQIDTPVLSRFNLIRIPNFTHKQIQIIFSKYLKYKLNTHLINSKTRDIIKAIFISQIEINEPELITKEFCCLNYPPLHDFVKNFKSKQYSLENIKHFSNKCNFYKISIRQIILDLMIILPPRKKIQVLQIGSIVEHSFKVSNSKNESLYIENLLCQIFL